MYFDESINSEIGFRAVRCDTLEDFQASLCNNNPSDLMGEPTRNTYKNIFSFHHFWIASSRWLFSDLTAIMCHLSCYHIQDQRRILLGNERCRTVCHWLEKSHSLRNSAYVRPRRSRHAKIQRERNKQLGMWKLFPLIWLRFPWIKNK